MHTQVTVNDLKQKVDLVLGRQNCELQLKNVRLINVFTGQIISGADIFIHNGKGPWWNAQALHMRIYIPNALFKRMGLYSLRLQRNA